MTKSDAFPSLRRVSDIGEIMKKESRRMKKEKKFFPSRKNFLDKEKNCVDKEKAKIHNKGERLFGVPLVLHE